MGGRAALEDVGASRPRRLHQHHKVRCRGDDVFRSAPSFMCHADGSAVSHCARPKCCMWPLCERNEGSLEQMLLCWVSRYALLFWTPLILYHILGAASKRKFVAEAGETVTEEEIEIGRESVSEVREQRM